MRTFKLCHTCFNVFSKTLEFIMEMYFNCSLKTPQLSSNNSIDVIINPRLCNVSCFFRSSFFGNLVHVTPKCCYTLEIDHTKNNHSKTSE